jgi:histone acetyltransferase (RNA polymerase elongator complex component)
VQEQLFSAVRPYVQSGEIHGVRLSTRPDCLDADICAFLKDMGVATVELGVQSMDDAVLARSRRGHSSKDCRRAVSLLKEAGVEVGVQLMPGLPGEETRSFFQGVKKVIELFPAFVRLYPVLVVNHSGLAEMYRLGQYRPLSLNKAVAMTRRARQMFNHAGIPVVRIGLQPSPSLERELVAGPYHPAFGELVASRDWLQRIRRLFAGIPVESRLAVQISIRDLSAFVGPKRSNMKRFEALGLAKRLVIETQKERERGTIGYVVS